MTDRDEIMRRAEEAALEAINRAFGNFELSKSTAEPGYYHARNPGGGLMKLKDSQHSYLYYEGPRGELYAYTPWKDLDGNYWTWTYKPTGKGSRSGDPSSWSASKIVKARSRKTAKKRCLNRLRKAMNIDN